MAGVLQNKKADLLSPDKHPLNYNLKRSEYEDVDTILYDLDVFFNELTKEAGYMSTKIKDESDAFVKSKSDEFAQSEKIKEARQKLYKKLGAFNILSTEVGNDENIKILWSIVFTVNDMILIDKSNPMLNNFKAFIEKDC